jgi:hypothetical protein
MNAIDRIANDIAMLSNESLRVLATILVRDYPTRAEVFEHTIGSVFEDTLRALHKELGLPDA